jgi:XdhC and CoxI family
MSWIADIARETAEHGAVVRVTVIRADGSTPREAGAAMLVGAGHIVDTIGGGALELEAIAHARHLLANAAVSPPPASKAPPSMLGGGRTERHGLGSPMVSLNSAANRRAKSDGVPRWGCLVAGTDGHPHQVRPAAWPGG